jgi:hypothetical protein
MAMRDAFAIGHIRHSIVSFNKECMRRIGAPATMCARWIWSDDAAGCAALLPPYKLYRAGDNPPFRDALLAP